MKRVFLVLFTALALSVIALVADSFAEGKNAANANQQTYSGGVTGRIKNVLGTPIISDSFILNWDSKKRSGKITLHMEGGMTSCNLSSSDGINFSGEFTGIFSGCGTEGTLKGKFSDKNESGIWQKVNGSFDMTVPEQGGAEYIANFDGALRNW